MSAMGPKKGKTVKELIKQIERFDEFLAPPEASTEHSDHINELLVHLSNIDEVKIPENKKLKFAKEVVDDYLQYEDCVSVIKAATREIYGSESPVKETAQRPPPPNFPPRDPTKSLPNKPPIKNIPIHFLKSGSVRQIFNDYFMGLAKQKVKIKEIKNNICDPTYGVASQWSAYPTAKFSDELFLEINKLDKQFQKQVALMPNKMKDSPVYEQELQLQKKIFHDVCDDYLQIRQKIAHEFKENSEPKQFLDAGKDKIKKLDDIFEKYIPRAERIKMYAQYGFSLSDEKSKVKNKKGAP